MRKAALIGLLVLIFLVSGSPQEQRPQRKKLLAIGMSAGFQHDSVSHGLATIWKIGQESPHGNDGWRFRFEPSKLHSSVQACI